jgi:hypothetical protein
MRTKGRAGTPVSSGPSFATSFSAWRSILRGALLYHSPYSAKLAITQSFLILGYGYYRSRLPVQPGPRRGCRRH